MAETRKRNRVHEIDFLRGALMILVIMDHVFWYLKTYNLAWFEASNVTLFKDVFDVFDFYWTSPARFIIRELVLFGFVTISGISCAFSKNNWKRAGLMLLVWGILAVVTNLINVKSQGSAIDFNVIGVLAWSVLFYCFFQKKSWRVLLIVLVSIFLFIILVLPPLHKYVIETNAYVPAITGPHTYYGEDGVINTGDWMPLFPYIFYFFFGALLSRFLYPNKQSLFKRELAFERPFCYFGRHSMWFYLAHMPICFLLFSLISLIVGA